MYFGSKRLLHSPQLTARPGFRIRSCLCPPGQYPTYFFLGCFVVKTSYLAFPSPPISRHFFFHVLLWLQYGVMAWAISCSIVRRTRSSLFNLTSVLDMVIVFAFCRHCPKRRVALSKPNIHPCTSNPYFTISCCAMRSHFLNSIKLYRYFLLSPQSGSLLPCSRIRRLRPPYPDHRNKCQSNYYRTGNSCGHARGTLPRPQYPP